MLGDAKSFGQAALALEIDEDHPDLRREATTHRHEQRRLPSAGPARDEQSLLDLVEPESDLLSSAAAPPKQDNFLVPSPPRPQLPGREADCGDRSRKRNRGHVAGEAGQRAHEHALPQRTTPVPTERKPQPSRTAAHGCRVASETC